MDKSKIAYWSEQIKLQKESGISQQKWCEENGIKYNTMKIWGTKLKNLNENSKPQFIELKPIEPENTAEIIEITIGKISIKSSHESFLFVKKELGKLC